MSPAPVIIAITGKGGVGKTALSASLARALIEDQKKRSLLLIDADPAQGLTHVMGVDAEARTIGEIRGGIIDSARQKGKNAKEEIAEMFDYLIAETLMEKDGFNLLAMGNHHTRGCFCPLNHLLRQAIESLSRNFDLVLVDAEAGVEQINREVVKGINTLVIMLDPSRRSVSVAGKITQTLRALEVECRVGAVTNRVRREESEDLAAALKAEGIELLGSITEDPLLRENDRRGKTIFDLPPEAPILEGARALLPGLLGNPSA